MSADNVPRTPARRAPALLALALIVAVEALGIAAVSVLGLLTGAITTSGIAVAVLGVVVGVLLAVVAVNLLRGRPWSRTAALTWQIVQLLVGLYAFQPPGARPDLGWLTIGPAVVAIVLLFTRSVRAATARV